MNDLSFGLRFGIEVIGRRPVPDLTLADFPKPYGRDRWRNADRPIAQPGDEDDVYGICPVGLHRLSGLFPRDVTDPDFYGIPDDDKFPVAHGLWMGTVDGANR